MGKKILVVDDEPDMLMAVQLKLEASGYEVFGAKTAAEGFRLIKEAKPDLAIIDAVLGVESGFEMCREVKKGYPGIKVILFTAKIDAIDAKRADDAGADDLIAKIRDMSFLLETMQNLLEENKEK